MKNLAAVAPQPGAETPFYVELGSSERLFAFLHQPAQPARAVIVFCHAFAEEKLWSHRVYVSFAREMAAQGIAVLRFDNRGEGDSSRDFEQSDVQTRVADIHAALDEAGRRYPLVPKFLVGHRLGGSLAVHALGAASDRVRGVIIWDPISDGREYFSQLLRSNMATQMATQGKVVRAREQLLADLAAGETIIADGYGLTGALYAGIELLQLPELPALRRMPALLLELPRGEQAAPSAWIETLRPVNSQLTAALVREPPFWREGRKFVQRAPEFSAQSLQWLQRMLA